MKGSRGGEGQASLSLWEIDLDCEVYLGFFFFLLISMPFISHYLPKELTAVEPFEQSHRDRKRSERHIGSSHPSLLSLPHRSTFISLSESIDTSIHLSAHSITSHRCTCLSAIHPRHSRLNSIVTFIHPPQSLALSLPGLPVVLNGLVWLFTGR